MNPDLLDPKLCVCGEMLEMDEEFCSKECEQDYYDVQFLTHIEAQRVAERVWYSEASV